MNNEPTRYDCLICQDTRFFNSRKNVLEHVKETHSTSSIWTAFINTPRRVEEFNEDIQSAVNDGVCPICNTSLDTDNPHYVGKHIEQTHEPEDAYQILLDAVPESYDHAPKYGDAGYDGVVGDVLSLTVGDRVIVTIDGWSVSYSRGRGKKRGQLSNEEPWKVTGVVERIEDERDDYPDREVDELPLGLGREVMIHGDAKTDKLDSSYWLLEVNISNYSDSESVTVSEAPSATTDVSPGGDGILKGDVLNITSIPWYKPE